jgi:2-haloacid dehalogenase
MKLTDFKALTFDCYGTLIDWESGMIEALRPLTNKDLKRHFKLVIFSNVDNESFSGSNEKLQVNFDAIYTAEDIGSYKPSSRNFEYMLAKLKTLGIEKHQILHTAESMFHDHGPANTHGLASCWIFRRHGQDGFGATRHPDEMPKYDFRFTSMADLVKAHQDALRG